MKYRNMADSALSHAAHHDVPNGVPCERDTQERAKVTVSAVSEQREGPDAALPSAMRSPDFLLDERKLQAPRASKGSSSSSRSCFTQDEKTMIEEYWPVDLVEERPPTYVDDPAEFIRVMLMDDYLEDIVVCRQGLEKLELSYEECFPQAIQTALDSSSSVKEFLNKMLDEPTVKRYKGRCQYLEQVGGLHHQREVRGGDDCLQAKIKHVMDLCKSMSQKDIDRLYVSEMRLAKEELHPIRRDEKVKSIMTKGMKDVLGQCTPYTAYWDRYDEGVFVGGPGSGKSFHVDQLLWCNVGKNYKGYKLVAAWPKDKAKLCKRYLDVLFTPPLSECDEAMLRSAAKIALIRPGDTYFFAGGVPHVTLSIGEGLNVASYESYVTLNRRAVQFFLMGSNEYMGTQLPLHLDALMPESEMNDVKDDIVDNMQDLAHVILGNTPYSSPSIGPCVDAIWKRTDALIPDLRRMFIEAVNLMCRDAYFRKELPRRVFEAIYFIEEEEDPEPLAKKPKLVTNLSMNAMPVS